MSALRFEVVKSRVETVLSLAGLLERVEASGAPIGADQYQALVRQLTLALAQEIPDEALQAVLGGHTAAAEVYENMHYAQSGLSRASLDQSVRSEMLASQAIQKARKR